ncbi:U2 snRNP complex subunit [Polyrhizophydium stewartii]|uniref:U2 small nuclear ribonucleoprotein A' n=1 Tax=Polyrhizophydium stewartii TaxID=2732419 RepID=A0ABR4MXD3_9FUNG|nr:U2 small nuclear ribonucleoprotein [Polyrhizophydium stewartii]
MPRLDFDLLAGAQSRINPAGDRELVLRGLKLQRIENLSLTRDQNDALDLTDNDLRRLDNFPLLPRLKTILAANNRITSLDPSLHKYIPSLRVLILANNNLAELGDLDMLMGFEHLEVLSLIDNPVAAKKHYRHYVIHRCPKVRILDFRRVREKERDEALALFSGKKGTALLKSLSKTAAVSAAAEAAAATAAGDATFVPGEGIPGADGLPAKRAPSRYQGPTPEEAERIRAAIQSAKTLEEIARLERQLQSGIVPEAK